MNDANKIIARFDALPIQKVTWDRILLEKDLSRMIRYFDHDLRLHINEGQLLQIRDGDYILEYLKTIRRMNEGEVLPREMMRPTPTSGQPQLTTEAAATIRHILYSNPYIGFISFPLLLQQFAVLLLGRHLKLREFPSRETFTLHNARLDNLDFLELGRALEASLAKLSPCGNNRQLGGGCDDTKHGNAGKTHLQVLAGDRGCKVPEEADEPFELYKIDPYIIVLNSSIAASSDTRGNVELNVEGFSNLPGLVAASYVVHATDQANDALKEGRETFVGLQELATAKGNADDTYSHGVKKIGSNLPDAFHIFMNATKYFSEGAMGMTVKGDFDQNHHREVSRRQSMFHCATAATKPTLLLR